MRNNGSDFMGIKEVAEFLNMSVQGIYGWVKEERIPGFKIDNTWRFKRSEIEKWLETKRVGPDPGSFNDASELLTNLPPFEDEFTQEKQQIELFKKQIIEALKNSPKPDKPVISFKRFQDLFTKRIIEQGLKELKEQNIFLKKDNAGQLYIYKKY